MLFLYITLNSVLYDLISYKILNHDNINKIIDSNNKS